VIHSQISETKLVEKSENSLLFKIIIKSKNEQSADISINMAGKKMLSTCSCSSIIQFHCENKRKKKKKQTKNKTKVGGIVESVSSIS
jgi:hypothetical protein